METTIQPPIDKPSLCDACNERHSYIRNQIFNSPINSRLIRKTSQNSKGNHKFRNFFIPPTDSYIQNTPEEKIFIQNTSEEEIPDPTENKFSSSLKFETPHIP